MINIDLAPYMRNSKYWSLSHGTFHYSHHLHRRSPFETDDSCGNCDGAGCNFCRKVYDDEVVSSGIEVDKLEEICKQEGVPEDIAHDMIYNDFYSPSKSGYRFIWPT